jgi:hypothetical protein
MTRSGRPAVPRPAVLLALGGVAVAALLGPAPRPAAAHPHRFEPPVDVVVSIRGTEVTALVDLEKWQILSWGSRPSPHIDLGLALPGPEAVRRLAERLEVAIDGEVVAPVLRGYLEAPVEEKVLSPRAKLSVAYLVKRPPTRVRILWKDFTGILWETERKVPLTVGAGPNIDTANLTQAEPEYTWHTRPPPAWRSAAAPPPPAPPGTRVPLAAVVLALAALVLPFLRPLRRGGAAARFLPSVAALSAGVVVLALGIGRVEAPWDRALPPSEGQARSVFVGLVKNVYLAFEAGSEREIYDLLAASVDRSLLDGLYGSVYESLVLRNAGGAVARIQDFAPGEVRVRFPANGAAAQFDVDGAWTITGAVSHWGHTHTRTIEYRAEATVRNDGTGWRLAAITMLEHKRTDDGTVGAPQAPSAEPAPAGPARTPGGGAPAGEAADPPK